MYVEIYHSSERVSTATAAAFAFCLNEGIYIIDRL